MEYFKSYYVASNISRLAIWIQELVIFRIGQLSTYALAKFQR